MALPSLRRDKLAIDDTLAVDPNAAALLNFKANISVTGHLLSRSNSGGQKNLNAMADRENPFLPAMEFLYDLDHFGIVSQKLWGAPANQQNSVVVRRPDLRNSHIRSDIIARFLDIRVPFGIEIMNDRLKPLFLRGRDNWLITGFTKSMLGIEDFKGFA